ncbi:MAG: hypothetical protein ACOYB3_00380 [Azonexus sp.]
MLEGRVKDWLSDRWNSVKAVTGIGGDEFGLGKNTEKGWKPKYGHTSGRTGITKLTARSRPRQDEPGPKTWDITP